MLLFPLAFVVGIALGWWRGGSLQSLAAVRLRASWLVAMAVLFQVGIGVVGSTGPSRFVALVGSYGMMGVWLVLILREGPRAWRGGFGCVAAGSALNLAAIVPNGSMPVSVAALHGVGASPDAFGDGPNLPKHVAAGDDTVWAWLGDVVPVRVLGAVISVGDIVMLAGVVMILYAGMTCIVPPSSDRGLSASPS